MKHEVIGKTVKWKGEKKQTSVGGYNYKKYKKTNIKKILMLPEIIWEEIC